MKKALRIVMLVMIACILSIPAFAMSGLSVSAESLVVEQGKTATFSVTADDAAGRIDISISDPTVATVSEKSSWLDRNTVSYTVTALKYGKCTITVNYTDVATYQEKVITGSHTVNVCVPCEHHVYSGANGHYCDVCGHEAESASSFIVNVEYNYAFYNGGPACPSVTVKDGDRTLVLNTDYNVSYLDNVNIGVATVRVTGLNDYYGEKDMRFEIRPCNVSTIRVAGTTKDSVTLEWTPSAGSNGYTVFMQQNNGGFREVGEATGGQYTVTGLVENLEYQFRIRPFAKVEETAQRLDDTFNTTYWSTRYSSTVSAIARDSGDVGGTGGTGGGGASSTVTASDVTLEMKTDSVSVAPKVTAKNGEAKTEITEESIADAFAYVKADKADTVVISPDIKGDADKIEVAIPKAALKDVDSGTDVTLIIHTNEGSVSIPSGTLSEIVKAAGGNDIIIVVTRADATKVSDKIPDSVNVLNAVAATVTITSDRQVISSFGGKTLEVQIPVSDSQFDEGMTYIAYVLSDDGRVEQTTATIRDGVAVITMKHLSTIVITADIASAFVDINATDYFYDAVRWAAANGITSGVDATHFAPMAITTRGQMVTFLWRAAGCPEPTETTCVFTDVKADSYYYKAVLWAAETGLTKGTSDTTFSPDAEVSRGQTVTFLARLNGVKDDATGYSHNFADVKTTDYYSNAVAWAATNKITDGTSATTFSPNDDCLRGQIVTFLYRNFVK